MAASSIVAAGSPANAASACSAAAIAPTSVSPARGLDAVGHEAASVDARRAQPVVEIQRLVDGRHHRRQHQQEADVRPAQQLVDRLGAHEEAAQRVLKVDQERPGSSRKLVPTSFASRRSSSAPPDRRR